VFKSLFKYVLIAALLGGCDDLPRDNLLDPRNESSYGSSAILLEAFVNTYYTELEYNFWTLQALRQVESFYGQRVIIAEYHRDIKVGDSTYHDPYSYATYDNRHKMYADADGTFDRAIPDIFINGDQGRVLGASSVASVHDRLQQTINRLLDEKSYYALEADLTKSNNTLTIDYRVARLGNTAAGELRLNVIFVKDYGSDYSRRVVTRSNYPFPNEIPGIKAGEIFKGQVVESLSVTDKPDAVILSLTEKNSISVLKSIEKVIP